MDRLKVIITRHWPAAAEAAFAARFDVQLNEADTPLDRDALARSLAQADVLCPTVTDRIDAALLGAPEVRTRLIANIAVGFNNVDVDAARAAGIAVTNTPGVLTDCTADLAMTLLLMAARRTGEGERELRAGAWRNFSPTHLLGRRVTGKTLGIIGAGRIGLAVAARAHHGFRMKILLHNRSPVPAGTLDALGAESCELEAVLARSDFVSLHCPATPETHHLIDAAALERMQPHAYLINTARGDVVDEAALVDALRSGQIGGAGLDVFEREPVVTPELMTLPNVALLPHMGSATEETREAMARCALANVTAFAAGEPLPNRVDA